MVNVVNLNGSNISQTLFTQDNDYQVVGIWVTNTTNTDQRVQVNLIPNGGNQDNTTLLYDVIVSQNSTLKLDEKMQLSNGDLIVVSVPDIDVQETNYVNVFISYMEI